MLRQQAHVDGEAAQPPRGALVVMGARATGERSGPAVAREPDPEDLQPDTGTAGAGMARATLFQISAARGGPASAYRINSDPGHRLTRPRHHSILQAPGRRIPAGGRRDDALEHFQSASW